ncbi:hypothetical protein J1N35_041199 [Gossypium stocksii]|uniref:Uncharacterized protein n=1 Tax=Gossypium stocksii TaxID=47602 RepID=A0A9D3UF13_9ROSI|nr:hypothetical protein J1N35_041199 [Gossypium stocksii]
MKHSSFDISEAHVIDNYNSWFNSKNGITGTGEESASLFHMPHLYPVPDLPQESLSGDTGETISSLVSTLQMMMDAMTPGQGPNTKTRTKVKTSTEVIPVTVRVNLVSLTVIIITLGFTIYFVKMKIPTASIMEMKQVPHMATTWTMWDFSKASLVLSLVYDNMQG